MVEGRGEMYRENCHSKRNSAMAMPRQRQKENVRENIFLKGYYGSYGKFATARCQGRSCCALSDKLPF